MRWTGLIISIAMLGLTGALFLASLPGGAHSLTIREAQTGTELGKAA
ncbi:hypothetical protein [Maricaulis sp.]|jgi:hypothetical protein|nr:hypothetical protein [Maricaulis sp.]